MYCNVVELINFYLYLYLIEFKCGVNYGVKMFNNVVWNKMWSFYNVKENYVIGYMKNVIFVIFVKCYLLFVKCYCDILIN